MLSRIPSGVVATVAVGLSVGLLAGCAFGPPTDSDGGGPPNLPAPTRTQSNVDNSPPSAIATVIARDLRVPWALAFLPDGSALATERDTRKIVKLGPGTDAQGLTKTTVQTVEEATASGEGGLLGIAASPQFQADQTVFVYYTTSADNRIARLKLGGRPEPIVTGIPVSGIHNGGRLHFGPDGYLYASTGDASSTGRSQDLKSLGGKILRMTTDGKPAPGNPFPDSLVWTYGHRNVQGFDWDANGGLFATEFGQNTWDEINYIKPGQNYGWPTVEGNARNPSFVDPIQQWTTSEASCSGAAMSGNVLVASCLRGQRLWLVRVTDDGRVAGSPVAALVEQYGRLREAVTAPDGSVWVTTSNHDGRLAPRDGDDKILRVVVSGGGAASKA